MKTEILKDKKNKVIGYIETDYKKRKTLRDKERHVLAYYYPLINITKDQFHNDICEGDKLGRTLLKKLKAEEKRNEKAREEFEKRREILPDDY